MCCLLDGGAVRHRGREAPRMEGQKMSLNIKWLSESIVFFFGYFVKASVTAGCLAPKKIKT